MLVETLNVLSQNVTCPLSPEATGIGFPSRSTLTCSCALADEVENPLVSVCFEDSETFVSSEHSCECVIIKSIGVAVLIFADKSVTSELLVPATACVRGVIAKAEVVTPILSAAVVVVAFA